MDRHHRADGVVQVIGAEAVVAAALEALAEAEILAAAAPVETGDDQRTFWGIH